METPDGDQTPKTAETALAAAPGYDALVTDLEIVKQKLESIRSNLSDNPADAEYQANDDVWWAIESVNNGRLLEWQDQSARSTMIFGPSIQCPNCHVMNNPNNPHCHQCHERL